ncbi:2-dehydro-3-deoxy-6-phosphogalactonate aldolase [Vineibacter terrae]|uniref:2-dehydro-3-deoxy-6-phosphogalactonate aldolase n=1 Tax=Vineibacter terrae TaxID=2586908 RepID=UPI002E2FBCB5|nr:2-dehydro-3-deoxy-6-phosphogalactonate aldolase [Vineibacter terrae]HEX2891152.1 2-dehydro-3-deoxy-6-phosphogalactonate aldolase [Vineibacter terrae]
MTAAMPSPASPGLRTALAACPLIAILRGLTPAEAPAIGAALVGAGFTVLEVPLNSPRPIDSIRQLATAHPAALVGAGTVMTTAEVDQVAAAGGQLIVMPHADLAVVRHARARGLACAPGVATPTEGFAALAAGADALKLFPGEMLTPAVLKALRAVFPRDVLMIPVGGVSEATMPAYWAAGADGFGIGSALYKPGATAADVARRAGALVDAARALRR